MSKRPPLKLFKPDEIKRSIAPLADQLPSSRSVTLEVIPPEPSSVDEYVAAIDHLWRDAERGFLAIGRYLHEAQSKLSPEAFSVLVGRLRFGKAVRSQLMTAYRAVSTGLVPRDIESAGYSVVYQVATMSDPERTLAREHGLIRPDVRREEVIAFKKRLRANRTDDHAEKPGRRQELEAERARLVARLHAIDRELSEIAS